MNIFLTGATGFVGQALLAKLAHGGHQVTVAVRNPTARGLEQASSVSPISSLSPDTTWGDSLMGIDVVVHAAARAHVMRDQANDPLASYRAVNVEGTLSLARAAVAAGVRRFIYISSIKVNGEATLPGRPFLASDMPAPCDPYGISKLEAEQALQALAAETGLQLVVIRPPLIYGRGVKGNFARMADLIEKGVPLPLGAIQNKRSFISIGNLVDLVMRCVGHPAAANQIFLASDGDDLSTPDLLRALAKAMGRNPRLIPVPAGLLLSAATLLGRGPDAQRLLGSLQVSIAKTCEVLEWKPPYTVAEGLKCSFSP